MTGGSRIPAAVRRRAPLIDAEGWRIVSRLEGHPDAPRFTYAAGDRLLPADLPLLEAFRERLRAARAPGVPGPPPPGLRDWIRSLAPRVPHWRRILPPGIDLAADWELVPTASRADLALRPWEFVPDGEDLRRLLIYRTAGTTGHPVSVPQHPRAIGCYPALVEQALGRHGVGLDAGPGRVACFLVSSQLRTYTYATALAAWGGAGFAKLNLRPTDWPGPGSARRYLEEFAPPLLTGDPVSFAYLRDMGARLRPLALVGTSVSSPPGLRQGLAAHFGAPYVDWYSLVETGPLACSCPHGDGWHVLPHDVHLEALDGEGRAVPAGSWGELAVTGGRNPFLPLLRYRTGDRARLSYAPCSCGETAPRILELEGRAAVLFVAADGTPVSTVDLSRCLREFPLLLHRFVQRADRTCVCLVRGLPGAAAPQIDAISRALASVIGPLPLEVRDEPRLGEERGGKVVPYESECEVPP